jgi:hypothetical protein
LWRVIYGVKLSVKLLNNMAIIIQFVNANSH